MTDRDRSARAGELGSYGPAGVRSSGYGVHHGLSVLVLAAVAWLLWLRYAKGVIKIEGA